METQNIDLLDEVHNAVPMLTSGPTNAVIKFDVSASAIAEMQNHAASLSIAGPDDKAGFKAVYDFRQIVAKQRVAVKKKQDAFKRPHIEYNREVDTAAKSLIDPMQKIEDGLAHQEKAYNDERERIAEEKAKAARIRYATRTKQLQTWGFAFNPELDTYEFGALIINVDDIRDLSDEDYQPTQQAAQELYQIMQDRLKQIELDNQKEAERIAAEQEIERLRLDAIAQQQMEAQIRLDAQAAELKRQQDQVLADQRKLQEEKDANLLKVRIDRLIAAGFTKTDGTLNTYHHFSVKLREGVILSFSDEQFDSVIADAEARIAKAEEERIAAEVAETQRIIDEEKAAIDKKKADKARVKRLAADKDVLAKLFRIPEERYTHAPLTQLEAQELATQFFDRYEALLTEFGQLAESL